MGYLFFWTNLKLFPNASFFYYKILNILFHAANAFLVSKILSKLNIKHASLLSLLYLIHPMHVETVSWVFQFLTISSATLFFLSYLSFIFYLDSKKLRFYFFSLILFLFSLWTKSNMLFAPFLYCFLFFKSKSPLKKYIYTLPFFMISLLIGTALIQSNETVAESAHADIKTKQFRFVKNIPRIGIYSKHLKEVPVNDPYYNYVFDMERNADVVQGYEFKRSEVMSQSFWYYFEKLIFPVGLQFIYPKKVLSFFFPLISFFFLFGLPLYFYKKTKNRNYVFIPTASAAFLLPFVGINYIAFFSWSFVSDHYAYGFIFILPFLIGMILDKELSFNRQLALGCYIFALVALNINYGLIFNNPKKLYPKILSHHPHPRIYGALFDYYLQTADLKNAEALALDIKAKFPNKPIANEVEYRLIEFRKNFNNN